tara:strand:- start:208 stop:711 length:504 start_codon:yes stop_codon:yes gene_type:complete
MLPPTKWGGCTLLSNQFLRTAEARLKRPIECTEADLRRATSDLYYAMFHRACEALVEPIGADPDNVAFLETYRTLYRLPDHNYLEKRCREVKDHAFSNSIGNFSRHIIVLKNKRQDADYDPLTKFAISAVENDLIQTRAALQGFNEADAVERARFAYFVSLRGRKLD